MLIVTTSRAFWGFLCDFMLKFFDNAVTLKIFLHCVLLAQSTNGLGSFVNISRSRKSPVERLRDISSGASRFVQYSTQIEKLLFQRN